jgi:hypothetical protein
MQELIGRIDFALAQVKTSLDTEHNLAENGRLQKDQLGLCMVVG